MAHKKDKKKKDKKKESRKKIQKKKKQLKKKQQQEAFALAEPDYKDLNKKGKGKKKDKKKNKKKNKKEGRKQEIQKQEPLAASTPPRASKPVPKRTTPARDHSSNYNVREALKRLRSLKSAEQIRAFTRGEKRVTVRRAIAAVLKKFPA